MAASAPKSYSTDPALYIYTSLTAGSSHIVTATSRLETILKANKIPFKAIDIATDDKARMLWGRRAGKDESGRQRKLPGLVQEGLVDMVEIEEWNEYGELKQHVKIYQDEFTITTPHLAPKPKPKAKAKAASKAAPKAAPAKADENVKPVPDSAKKEEPKEESKSTEPAPIALAIRQIGAEAAQKANEAKKKAYEKLVGDQSKDKEVPKDEDKGKEVKADTKQDKLQENEEGQKGEKEEKDKKAEPETPAKSSTIPKEEPAIKETILEFPATSEEDALAARTSLQSPTSTAWKTISPFPLALHQGSVVKEASEEKIRAVEGKQTIVEESDEEESSEEESSNEEEEVKK